MAKRDVLAYASGFLNVAICGSESKQAIIKSPATIGGEFMDDPG